MKIFKFIILALCFFVIIGCLYLGTVTIYLDFSKIFILSIICIMCLIISFVIIENFK